MSHLIIVDHCHNWHRSRCGIHSRLPKQSIPAQIIIQSSLVAIENQPNGTSSPHFHSEHILVWFLYVYSTVCPAVWTGVNLIYIRISPLDIIMEGFSVIVWLNPAWGSSCGRNVRSHSPDYCHVVSVYQALTTTWSPTRPIDACRVIPLKSRG